MKSNSTMAGCRSQPAIILSRRAGETVPSIAQRIDHGHSGFVHARNVFLHNDEFCHLPTRLAVEDAFLRDHMTIIERRMTWLFTNPVC
jgi:hypothetical protein